MSKLVIESHSLQSFDNPNAEVESQILCSIDDLNTEPVSWHANLPEHLCNGCLVLTSFLLYPNHWQSGNVFSTARQQLEIVHFIQSHSQFLVPL